MKLICYKNCTTCKNLKKILDEKNISYEERDIKDNNPSKEEIKKWHESTEYDIKKFFNSTGKIYRENNLKDKLPDMTLDEKYEILSKDGMLVKRPILFTEDGEIFLGPDAKKYVDSL